MAEEIKEELDNVIELDAVTDEQIEAAEKVKKKFNVKKVFLIGVQDEDTGEWLEGYFRKPNLKEFSMFTTVAQKDKIQALQVLMTNVFLQGDKRLIEEDDYFLSAMSQIEEIVNVQASRIKKF